MFLSTNAIDNILVIVLAVHYIGISLVYYLNFSGKLLWKSFYSLFIAVPGYDSWVCEHVFGFSTDMNF